MRAPGFSRLTLRIADRASWSADAVTVQEFRTTMSAADEHSAGISPRSANCRSMDAPSAWVARHPKFSTKNVGTLHDKPSRPAFCPFRFLPTSTDVQAPLGLLRFSLDLGRSNEAPDFAGGRRCRGSADA